jgi:mannose-6-phosphate isomerase-like protein (cupin superfamily)
MKGYIANIEELTLNNNNFRQVLYTGKNSQLVLMSLQPGEEIGMEVHEHIDQFFRVEKGTGKVILDGVETEIKDGTAIVIPAGTNHNVVNTSSELLKVYTIYSPPEHIDGTLRATKQDAIDQPEEFDGKTTE